jgi:hypothetical protein
LRRMLNQAQGGALDRWSTNVRELARQRDIMDRVVMRWKLKTTAMCLEFWQVHWAEEQRRRHIMTKIVLRMSQRSVVQALDRWLDVVEEVAASRAEAERKQDVMSKIVESFQRITTLLPKENGAGEHAQKENAHGGEHAQRENAHGGDRREGATQANPPAFARNSTAPQHRVPASGGPARMWMLDRLRELEVREKPALHA